MQTFADRNSPRVQCPLDQLPRGVVKFPAHILDSIARERAKFAPEVFTEEYARKSLEHQTLVWYYDGLPVAYKPVADGIEVLAVGWEATAKYRLPAADPEVKVVQP